MALHDAASILDIREPDDAVVDALTAFQRADIDFALLRGGADQLRAGGDVDVLVRSSALAQAERCLRDLGWLAAPSSGHGSHRFHVLYTPGTGRWHKLDLVTSLDFGRLQAYRTDLADSCLARTVRRTDGLPQLHPDDAFWSLFLHLAWKETTGSRNETLRRQARDAAPDGPVAELVGRLLPGGPGALGRTLAAARAGDWDAVRAAQGGVRVRWGRSRRVDVARSRAGNWVRQRASLRSGPGLSFALLGLDGAGKTTVASELTAEVPWPTVSLYMGVWRTSAIDRLLRRVLGAQLVLRLGRLGRVALQTRYHRALGRLVLLDRYVVDATLPSSELDWKGRVSAALVLRTAAAPDRMVFLDAPPEVVFARKGELTLDELHQRREYYVEVSDRFPQWVSVNVDRPLEQVLAEVNELLWADLARLRRGRSG